MGRHLTGLAVVVLVAVVVVVVILKVLSLVFCIYNIVVEGRLQVLLAYILFVTVLSWFVFV